VGPSRSWRGGQAYFAHSLPNAVGGTNGAAVRNAAGQILSQSTACPSLHGNNSAGAGGVFGCSDGFLLVRASGTGATVEKITPSGDMAGLGLRNAYTTSGASFILGQFAAQPGQPAQRVLATINPTTGALGRLPALPAGVTDHWRAVEPINGQIVLLGTDGVLYIYDGSTRQLQRSVAGVVPALPTTGALTHQIAVAEDLAVVANPTQGQVVLVNLATGVVQKRITVPGQPSRIALLGVTDNGMYEESHNH